jgi:CRISPR-associated protein Cmr2
MAKAVASTFPANDLIFPAATDEDLRDIGFQAVNKVLALAKTDDPGAMAAAAKRAALNRLLTLARTEMRTPESLDYESDRLLQHLEGVFEFYAAWVPYSGPQEYRNDREEVERLLDARKTLNGFSFHPGVPGRTKSSLDGGRESVILARGGSAADLIRLREDEHLDGTGLLKRYLSLDVRFESTTEVAALPYVRKVERIAREDADLAMDLAGLRRLNELARLRWDSGALLFDFESRPAFANDCEAKEALDKVRSAIQAPGKAGKPEAPYYALMVADGDSMGAKLHGLTIDEHRAFSRELSQFARTVRRRLEEIECMPVFAGGDDILAVIPLHRLREAAWMVREEFGKLRAGTNRVTLSAGIALCHALDPLDEVRERAKTAEGTAKSVDGKDAVCLAVYPRSGAPVLATGKWDEMGNALTEITEALAGGTLSFGLAHEFRQLLNRISATGYPHIQHLLPHLALSIAEKKKKDGAAAVTLVKKVGNREELEALTDRILAARKLARAEKDALAVAP